METLRTGIYYLTRCDRAWPLSSEYSTYKRVNMAHMRQSRPDSGLGFQVKPFRLIPLRSSPARLFYEASLNSNNSICREQTTHPTARHVLCTLSSASPVPCPSLVHKRCPPHGTPRTCSSSVAVYFGPQIWCHDLALSQSIWAHNFFEPGLFFAPKLVIFHRKPYMPTWG